MRRPDSPQGKKRPLRVAAEILREMPDILRNQVELPDGLIVSVTDVEVSDDLTYAKVYFSVFGQNETSNGRHVEQILNGRRGAVRHEIAQRLIMRQHPEFRFYYDETPARAARIEQLLKQVRDESQPPEGEEPA